MTQLQELLDAGYLVSFSKHGEVYYARGNKGKVDLSGCGFDAEDAIAHLARRLAAETA